MRISRITLSCPLIVGMAVIFFTGCKPTEKNYRQAYDITMAARQAAIDSMLVDSLHYTTIRPNDPNRREETTPAGNSVSVRANRLYLVAIDEGVAPSRESYKRYNVVAAKFKQIFNARAMCHRLADNGFPGVILASDRDDQYYVIAASVNNMDEALSEADKVIKAKALGVQSGCPFILDRGF